jgi:hypothetical protein
MWCSGRPVMRVLAGVLGSAGCRERAIASANVVLATTVEPPTCGDSLRPATAAPAEGFWVFEDSAVGRITAMVGPSRVNAGETRVMRRVETIEARPDGRTIRNATDTAAARLELLPAPPDSLGRRVIVTGSNATPNPAAVYAVGNRIVLASYEPCAATGATPRLRYLRRDADGHPVIDVMLRRTSGGN